MKKLPIYLAFILPALFSTCTIYGTMQGLVSYHDRTDREQPGLLRSFEPLDSLFTKNEEAQVVVINGKDLRKHYLSEEQTVVYLWAPNCKSPLCRPLGELQARCDSSDLQLLVVAEYYDGQMMAMNHNIEMPIFGIDTKYYGNDFTRKYLSAFVQDLASTKRVVEHRFLYFNQGDFRKSYNSLADLISSLELIEEN